LVHPYEAPMLVPREDVAAVGEEQTNEVAA
jgi:hypothetical protein